MKGKSKLARTAWSGAPAPRFVNNDPAAAERSYTTAHARHTATAWSGATLQEGYLGSTQESGLLLRGLGCVRRTRRERGEIVCLLPRPQGPPGEHHRVCGPRGSASLQPASQLVPRLPWAQQAVRGETQRDRWRHQQDRRYKGKVRMSLPSSFLRYTQVL